MVNVSCVKIQIKQRIRISERTKLTKYKNRCDCVKNCIGSFHVSVSHFGNKKIFLNKMYIFKDIILLTNLIK